MNFDIRNGDCIEQLMTLEDNSVDTIVTSPPYNKQYFQNGKENGHNFGKIAYDTFDDNMPLEDYEAWMIKLINLCIDKLKPTGSLFFNHKNVRYDGQYYTPYSFVLKTKAKFYQEIVWDRSSSVDANIGYLTPTTERIWWLVKDSPVVFKNNLDSKYRTEVWRISPKAMPDHPAPFPQILADNCIKLTCPEGGVVLDPFLGSGTSALAAFDNKKDFIGFEISEKYYNLAKSRLDEIQNSLFGLL